MTCVVVLGPHRSGTSLVARILQNAGVFMGERFREPDEFNPEGYCEDLDFKELNQAILKRNGYTWWNCDYPEDIEPDLKFTMRLEELVENRIANHEVWGFKDPRMALLLDLYKPYLPSDAKYIVVSRDVDAIANSLHHREYIRDRRVGATYDLRYWKRLTQQYYSLIMGHTPKMTAASKTVNYEHLISVSYAPVVVANIIKEIFYELPTVDVLSKILGMIRYEN